MHLIRVAAALTLAAPALLAQGVAGGRALDARSDTPATCTSVLLRDGSGTVIARTMTRADGTFAFESPPAGVYQLRFHSPAYAPMDAQLDSLTPTSSLDITFRLNFKPVSDGFIPEDTAGRTPPRPYLGKGIPKHPWRRGGPDNGDVLIRFVIGADGKPERGSEVVISSSHPAFERAVLDALPQQRYEPATLNGAPTCLRIEMPYVFNRAYHGTLPVSDGSG